MAVVVASLVCATGPAALAAVGVWPALQPRAVRNADASAIHAAFIWRAGPAGAAAPIISTLSARAVRNADAFAIVVAGIRIFAPRGTLPAAPVRPALSTIAVGNTLAGVVHALSAVTTVIVAAALPACTVAAGGRGATTRHRRAAWMIAYPRKVSVIAMPGLG